MLTQNTILNHSSMLEIVERAYAARVSGDKVALEQYWAPNARFEIVGDQSLVGNVPLGASKPMDALSVLIDRFEFSDLEKLDAVVDGKKMAIRWAVTMRVAGKRPVRTQLFDLITFDDSGKIASFVQFGDTALIRHLAK